MRNAYHSDAYEAQDEAVCRGCGFTFAQNMVPNWYDLQDGDPVFKIPDCSEHTGEPIG